MCAHSRLCCCTASQLGQLARLSDLQLSGNGLLLGATIPTEIGRLQRMVNFLLSDCNLRGTLPPGLDTWTSLAIFSIGGNQMIGSVPNTSMWTSLNQFQVQEVWSRRHWRRAHANLRNSCALTRRTHARLLAVSSQNFFSGPFPMLPVNANLNVR